MVEVTSSSGGVVDFETSNPSLAVEHDSEMDTSLKASKKKDKGTKESVEFKELTKTQQLAYGVLEDLIEEKGTMQTVNGMRNKCIDITLWRDGFKNISNPNIKDSSFTSSFYIVKKELKKLKKVNHSATLAWIVFPEKEGMDSLNSNVLPLKK